MELPATVKWVTFRNDRGFAVLSADLDRFSNKYTIDMEDVIKEYLHPKYKNKRLNELLQSAMASRIFPDNFLDKNYLIVMSLIEEQEGDDDIDVVGIISMVQDGTSIGYEGRGRVEDLEVAGVAHEQEMEKLSKELGLG